MTNTERKAALKTIWARTSRDYRGKLDGERAILVLNRSTQVTELSKLSALTDEEIVRLMPHVPETREAAMERALRVVLALDANPSGPSFVALDPGLREQIHAALAMEADDECRHAFGYCENCVPDGEG